uniref:Uncharacterized protein n=1 Tax=viral metagenome TaxID=1070528 RepID=A0A6M3XQ63_9ZZZZ
MPTKLELLQEAAKRGILPENKKAAYEEAVRRGLIKSSVDDIAVETTSEKKSDFLEPPSGETQLSQERPIRRDLSKIYTPVLEGLGFLGGASVGAATGNPILSALSAGSGYAMAKSGARRLDELVGLNRPQTLGQAASESVRDVLTGTAMEMGGQVINKALIEPALQTISQRLSKTIRSGIERGVKPLGKVAENEAYYQKAEEGVKNIILNKENLVFTDKKGEQIFGKVPTTLKEFDQSIHQTLKRIFNQYDELKTIAGESGEVIDLVPIAKELEKVAKSKIVQNESPEIAVYAAEKAERYINSKFYTPAEAQDAIATINEELKSFYKNPKYNPSSRKVVDDLAVTYLRKGIDDAVGKIAEVGAYQELKNAYGSVRGIEDAVRHRVAVDSRKNKGGFFGYADIWTAAEVVSAISDPAKLPRAAAIQGTKMWLKWRDDPNRIVKDMFKEADKLMSSLPQKIKDDFISSAPIEKIENEIYRYNPEFKGTKSTRPKPIKTELHEAEPALIIPTKEQLFPDQLATVRSGKMSLQDAINKQGAVGRPLILPNLQYLKSTRPLTVEQLLKK